MTSAPKGHKYPSLDKKKFGAVGSVEVVPATETSGPVRRCVINKDALVHQPLEGIETVTDVLLYAARTHGTRNAMGWRDIIKVVEEEKEITKTIGGKETKELKTWKYFQLSEFKYINYVELKERAFDLGKGLVDLGVEKGQIFNIYAATGHNWQSMQHACSAIGVPIATAYDTLGESGLTHSLNEPDCVGVFTNGELLPTLASVIENTPTVKIVIYDGDAPKPDVLEKLKANDRHVLTIEELRERGKGKPDITERHPKKEDLACIMYTSGTTGAPKGVILLHSMLIASVGAVKHLLGHVYDPHNDSFLAFLPCAHILEYIVELAHTFLGVRIGYGRIKTLADTSVRECNGDIREFAPTIMVGVPAIWEQIRKGIIAKVNKSGAVKKAVFGGSMSIKKANVPILADFVDNVVLSAVKQSTGGNLRFVLSGGAALSKETQDFLTTALVTVLQGYGMTESCGMCAILPPEMMQLGVVGVPVPSVDVKLLDVDEAGYKANGPVQQGEVLIRGPSVTKGYYKRDDLNSDRSIFTEDGWFRTGDVGQWNKDGTLSIIDRVKNLVKLASGEYVALERLETAYRTSSLVSNVCIHATADHNKPLAIVFPHEVHLRDALGGPGLPAKTDDIHKLCDDEAVNNLVFKDLLNVAKKNGFKGIETIQSVVLTPDEWTPQSGLVTAAQKIQRKKIEETFKAEIEAGYKRGGQ